MQVESILEKISKRKNFKSMNYKNTQKNEAPPLKSFIKAKDQKKFLANVAREFKPKGYTEEMKSLAFLARDSRYFFNLISALGAGGLVYTFFHSISSHYVAIVITVFCLTLWEFAKVKISEKGFKSIILRSPIVSLLLLLLLIDGGSIAATYFGTKETVSELSGEAKLLNIEEDPEYQLLASQKATKEESLSDLENNPDNRNSKGQLLYNLAQHTKPSLLNEIAEIDNRMREISQKFSVNNENVRAQHGLSININSKNAALITIVSEILFLICSFHWMKYKANIAVELGFLPPIDPNGGKKNREKSPNHKLQPVATDFFSKNYADLINNQNELEALTMALKNAESNLRAWESKKRKGIGLPETADKHIEKWSSIIEDLSLRIGERQIA